MLKWIIYSEQGEGEGTYTAWHSRDREEEKEEAMLSLAGINAFDYRPHY